jgi:hypothetical protein
MFLRKPGLKRFRGFLEKIYLGCTSAEPTLGGQEVSGAVCDLWELSPYVH